jgi:Raf kinase inhibitor-like YbhB/YbcL family protein
MVNDPNWRLPEVPTFTLQSPEFGQGDLLPQWARSGLMGAGGEDRSPTLHWEGAPSGTRSFAVTMYDPDAPTGSGWWHWAVYNLDAKVTSLPPDAGNPDSGQLPAGARTVPNESRQQRYLGAAPPPGHGEHRYFFTVSALSVERLDLPADCTPAILGQHITSHIVGRAQLVGISES